MSEVEELHSLLDRIIHESVRDERPGVLFSGGLDSTIIGSIALSFTELSAYTVGVEGSHDLTVSKKTAEALGMTWKPIIVTNQDIIDSIRKMLEVVPISDPLTVSFQLPAFLVAEKADERTLLSGQGADELFGGYARYENMDISSLEHSMNADLEKLIKIGSDIDRSIALHFGKKIVHPYLDERFVREVTAIPVSKRMHGGVRKALLREIAISMGLEEVSLRPKKAAQYGSGIMKVMKCEAKRKGIGLRDLITELSTLRQESLD